MRADRAIAAVLAAALASPVTSRVADHLATQPSLCPLLAVTGVPCPSCGGTRAVLHLAAGDVGAAVALNPGVTLFAVVVGALIAAGIVPWREILGVAKPPAPVAHFSR
ncbi:MAG: DUF2752 domain-containing protein [Actinomycetota bacterium]